MECKQQIESKLAQDNETYYFYCSVKNSMVDFRDCQKCKYNKFRRNWKCLMKIKKNIVKNKEKK
jgi:hypothetical protein